VLPILLGAAAALSFAPNAKADYVAVLSKEKCD
jgi:hypothetical protein